MIDYVAMMREYLGRDYKEYLTNLQNRFELAPDAIIKVTYDAQNFRWIPNRPSGIVYPKAKELIEQFRREYAEKWG